MRNYMGKVYMALFGAYMVLVGLFFYAPLWVAILGGMAVILFFAISLSKEIEREISEGNPFKIAKELGKEVVFAFIPPKTVKLLLADKELSGNKIRIRVLKEGQWVEDWYNLDSEQELNLEVPDLKIKEEISVYEIFRNPYVVFELEEPSKQIWKLQPYNLDAVFFVFPNEVLTVTQLKVMNLKQVGTEKKKVSKVIVKDGIPKETKEEIVVPVYAPQPYGITTDNVKEISAIHRFSQIGTLLETTRGILRHAERVSVGIAGIGAGIGSIIDSIKKNPMLLIMLLLLPMGILFLVGIMKITGAMSAKATAGMVAKFPKTYP